MKASVIIPTRDRASLLSKCLGSLCIQTMDSCDFEVIVVDNGSTDATKAIVDRYISRLPLRYIREPSPGLHAGRHCGLRHAQADVLVFCDDDIEAEPIWVESIVDTFSGDDIALVGGNNRPNFEHAPPGWLAQWWGREGRYGRAMGYLSILDFGLGTFEIQPEYVWGCNFSIRRAALLAAGGFHPDAMPPDRLRWRGDGETHVAQSVHRQGSRAVFNGKASVRHWVPAERMTPEYFAKRAYAQGISDSFSDIRAAGAVQSHRPLRRVASGLRSVASQRLCALLNRTGSAAEELQAVQRACTLAYASGYAFHRREVRQDPTLLAWVLKESYLNG